jgi:type IV secretory pathway VirJ component
VKRLVICIALAATSTSLAAASDERCSARVDVTDIPVIELPARKASDRFAVMITGDGGWRRIDSRVTEKLRTEGIAVVGFLTPDYFRTPRTPEESACALERVIRFYRLRWHREHVLLIGYSRGADVLPFMASRLPSDLRSSLRLIALLGLEPLIDFQYRPWWMLWHTAKTPQYAVEPEVEKLRGNNVVCIYGEREKDSLCRRLDRTAFKIVREPGGHHFAGRYRDVADVILSEAK